MRFTCHFEHQFTGERKTIVAALSQAECRSLDDLRRHEGCETADVTAEAFALRKCYSEVPRGFLHTEPPKLMLLA